MNFLPLIFLLTAIVLYIVTIFLVIHNKRVKSRYFLCVGKIIRFNKDRKVHVPGKYNGLRITPILRYTVNGCDYEVAANFYSTNLRVGNEIKLLCDKDDQSNVTTLVAGRVASLITGGLALFSILMTVFMFVLCKGYK